MSRCKLDDDADVDPDHPSYDKNKFHSRCSYDLDHFFAVVDIGREGSTSLKSASIVDSKNCSEGNEISMVVRWFENFLSLDMYTANYRLWFMSNGSTGTDDVPWTDRIRTKSLMISFVNKSSRTHVPGQVLRPFCEISHRTRNDSSSWILMYPPRPRRWTLV